MRIRALVAILGLLAIGAVACENEEGGGGGGGDSSGRPGVTDDEIQVGGVAGFTNPVGRPYQAAFVGGKAYFDIVNENGGIYDRDIVIVAERDDRAQLSSNVTEVRALVEEDNVFAALPIVAQNFGGAEYLAEQGTPTFGWNINAEWSEGPNLFGAYGSYLCFECPGAGPAYVAQQTGATTAAIFAYGQSPQSTDCATGVANGFEKFGMEVGFQDTSLSFGFTDTSAAVQGVRDSGADILATCMDLNGTATLAGDLADAGLDLVVYSPEGYDQATLQDLGDQLEGFYILSQYWPFEEPNPPKGMRDYLAAMEDVGQQPNEHSLVGWVNADLFVTGLQMAGEDFTQESVVDAINSIESYDASGMTPPTHWAINNDYPEGAHGPATNGQACSAFVHVENGEFVPAFGQPGKPFVCFEGNNEEDGSGVPSIDNPIFLG